MKTLHDGSLAPSSSEAWRHECETRTIMGLSTLEERRAWLDAVERKRGKAAADALREKMRVMWGAKKGKPE